MFERNQKSRDLKLTFMQMSKVRLRLAFEPSGVLYVGNNDSPAKIHRIGVGGSPIEEFGDTALLDPDAVTFDASGAISGMAGSVLVGNSDPIGQGPGFIAAILPDQSTVIVLGGPEIGLDNPRISY